MAKEELSKNRHLTEKKVSIPTDGRPFISCGTRERSILGYMILHPEQRFNVTAFSKHSNIKRSSIYDNLNKLISKNYVLKVPLSPKSNISNFYISEQGKHYFRLSENGVGASRRECRTGFGNLSTHYMKFVSKIISKSSFFADDLKKLCPLKFHHQILPNLEQYFLYFSNCTVIISPKQVSVRVHDIVNDNVDDSIYAGFMLAISYLDRLSDIGVLCESIILEPSHFARMNSVFAEFLEKIDKRYFIELPNGKKFWVDNSDTGSKNIEDETNDEDYRKRLDSFLKDLQDSKSNMSDLDKLIQVTSDLVKLQSFQILNTIEQKPELKKNKPDYYG